MLIPEYDKLLDEANTTADDVDYLKNLEILCPCCDIKYVNLEFTRISPVAFVGNSIVFGYLSCPISKRPMLLWYNPPNPLSLEDYIRKNYKSDLTTGKWVPKWT